MFVEHRMNPVVQVRLPECSDPIRQISGDTGIFNAIAMIPQPHQFVSNQQTIQREDKQQQYLFG
jgi:hypothetical protein